MDSVTEKLETRTVDDLDLGITPGDPGKVADGVKRGGEVGVPVSDEGVALPGGIEQALSHGLGLAGVAGEREDLDLARMGGMQGGQHGQGLVLAAVIDEHEAEMGGLHQKCGEGGEVQTPGLVVAGNNDGDRGKLRCAGGEKWNDVGGG